MLCVLVGPGSMRIWGRPRCRIGARILIGVRGACDGCRTDMLSSDGRFRRPSSFAHRTIFTPAVPRPPQEQKSETDGTFLWSVRIFFDRSEQLKKSSRLPRDVPTRDPLPEVAPPTALFDRGPS